VLEICKQDPRFHFPGRPWRQAPTPKVAGKRPPSLSSFFRAGKVDCDWLVDRVPNAVQFLKAQKLGLCRAKGECDLRPWRGPGAGWWMAWSNIEKLTRRTPKQIRINRDRMKQGHFPYFLATNHFCGEGPLVFG